MRLERGMQVRLDNRMRAEHDEAESSVTAAATTTTYLLYK